MHSLIEPEVEATLKARRAVVALESTLVAHGLPWPQNFEVAQELEAVVRKAGAVPATIAVIDGKVKVGLSTAELEAMAKDGTRYAKAGSTDLAVHVARGGSAATTVSATAVLAARAGIRVFATGGIGGVHRGESGDVSHDLIALARTPIAVVSAGAKAILDLAKTLETLETFGVLVLGYKTRHLPAFYAESSGLTLEHSAETIDELAAIARAHWEVLGGAGILVCNPIPKEAALDLEGPIADALADASTKGISGKSLTPYLLARLATETAGASVKANRALARNNAEVAATLAVSLVREKPSIGFRAS